MRRCGGTPGGRGHVLATVALLLGSFFLCAARGQADEKMRADERARAEAELSKSTSDGPPAVVDLEHGRRQVARMVASRPAMAQYVTRAGTTKKLTPKSPVWMWCARHYGTSVLGAVIEWDPADLNKPDHYLAEHSMPYRGTKAYIRIRGTFRALRDGMRPARFDELWSACVFELINIRNDAAFLAIYRMGVEGKLTRRLWIRLNTELEYNALRELQKYYRKEWLPWARANNYKPEGRHWHVSLPKTYEAWIGQYQKSKDNPYRYWEDYYDKQLAPYLEAQKQRKAAEAAAEAGSKDGK